MNPKYLLAIESSCDDCAVAILDANNQILADVKDSQIQPHAPFGGIVPEIASRQHLEKITVLVQEALRQALLKPKNIEAVAVTHQPGLIGSLLVGVQFAVGFAQALQIPIMGVDHMEGHLLAGFGEAEFPTPPFIGLIASGGHSALYLCDENYDMQILGQTRDDAAGEAFDKIGRLMGLVYPAGKEIDCLAQTGDSTRFQFPIALPAKSTLDYSFSGLKTAAKLQLQKQKLSKQDQADFCASLQEAIAKALLAKALLACRRHQINKLVLGGGVIANSCLRIKVQALSKQEALQVYLPLKTYCTDNAVMIARAARRRFLEAEKRIFNFSISVNSN